MSVDKSYVIDAPVQERVHRLWDELAGFNAAETEQALMHLLRTAADMVDAQNAYWLGAVRAAEREDEPHSGWRPRVIRHLRDVPEQVASSRDRIRSANRGVVDVPLAAHARRAGSYRAHRLREVISPEWFVDDDGEPDYMRRGVHDTLVVVAPVSSDVEAYYGFVRMRRDEPFTDAERNLAFYVMRGLTWFHRQVMLSHGLGADQAPLSPMERRVLAALLTERSEKRIAIDLEISPSTLHSYVRDVLRKCRVSGRAGLAALWLGGAALS